MVPFLAPRIFTPPDLGGYLDLVRTANVGILGDSISDIDFNAQTYWWRGLRAGVDGAFGDGDLPTWVDSATAGNTVADIDVATRVTAHGFTKLIVLLGVNDVIAGVSDASFEASYRAMVTAIVAGTPALAEHSTMLVTPWLRGSVRPSGSNADDANMDAKAAIVEEIAADNGMLTVNVRDPYFDELASPATLCSDGVHPTVAGASWIAGLVMRRVRVMLED